VTPLLALLLAAGFSPVRCPPGAAHRGGPPPDDALEWCEIQGEDGKPRREGPARTFYDDGTPWIEEHYRDGLRDGHYVEHHRGGGKAREGDWVKDRKVGTWTIWSPDGKVEEESTWKDGVLHGPFVSRWPTGALRSTGRFCRGVQCGVWITYDEQGKEIGRIEYEEQHAQP
jgi:antitoxin component YwqK of YwqJK toxin-antitoxin module